jgi:dihydrolipoamide dehydrogenase
LIFTGSDLKDYFKMTAQKYDMIVIGAGVGGYTAALEAARCGASVALVEKGSIGGTCLNIGCIPTKALLESCRLASQAKRADEFGVTTGTVGLVPEKMVARSRSIVGVLTKGVDDSLGAAGVKVMRGAGRLVSAKEVAVMVDGEGLSLKGKAIIIATGSSWVSLPGVDIDGRQIITSDHALSLANVPGEIVIVGGGAIGCEFAEVYSALGTHVTIVEMMEHILPGEDGELARRLEAALKRKGMKIMTKAKVSAIARTSDAVAVTLEGGGTLEAAQVLMAIGRSPDTENVGLGDIGIAMSGRAVATDEEMRTNVPGVFAVGDVTGKWMLAHVAVMQGIVAGANACGGKDTMDYSAVPRCVYTAPELAAVGLTEEQALKQGKQVKVHRERLGNIGRAHTLGETFGMAKAVIEDGTGRILGFQALCPHASEVVSEVSLAIRAGMDIDDIAGVIHPHPTLSELVWECFKGAAHEFPETP